MLLREQGVASRRSSSMAIVHAEDKGIPAERRDWNSLSPDVQELILSRLPISSCIKLAAVSKKWHSTLASPSFSALLQAGKHPLFFLWGINELIHTRSVGYIFDPIAGSWFTSKSSRPPDFNRTSLSGTNGLLFAFSGSKVCYSPIPSSMKWQETPPASSPRCSSLLGAFGSVSGSAFKLLIVGGMLDGDERTVELYDSSTNAWEQCPPFPDGGFFEGISSHWMSSAVLGHKFYVADVFSGDITSFDTETKEWSRIQNLRVPKMMHLLITAGEEGLYALCVCRQYSTKVSLKLFKVDELSMECLEVSEMPQELYSVFGDEGDEKQATNLSCVGSGNLFYVYIDSYYKDYPVCMCYMAEGCYQWKKLPSLPDPLPRFDRVVCCTTILTPMACLKSLKS